MSTGLLVCFSTRIFDLWGVSCFNTPWTPSCLSSATDVPCRCPQDLGPHVEQQPATSAPEDVDKKKAKLQELALMLALAHCFAVIEADWKVMH